MKLVRTKVVVFALTLLNNVTASLLKRAENELRAASPAKPNVRGAKAKPSIKPTVRLAKKLPITKGTPKGKTKPPRKSNVHQAKTAPKDKARPVKIIPGQKGETPK